MLFSMALTIGEEVKQGALSPPCSMQMSRGLEAAGDILQWLISSLYE